MLCGCVETHGPNSRISTGRSMVPLCVGSEINGAGIVGLPLYTGSNVGPITAAHPYTQYR